VKLHLLQQALTALRVTGRPETARTGDPRDAAGARAPAARREDGPPRSLADRIQQQVRAISPDDPQRRRRLLRCTLEACLQAEWGDAVADDPAFHALVDQVQQRIENEPSLQRIVDDALASLDNPDTSEQATHDHR
jgi:hypothetical protein